MPYWTKGVVTFRTSTPRTISINPHTDYQVIDERGIKYIIFIEADTLRNYPIDKPFEIDDNSLEPLLIQAAFNNVCLRIAINPAGKVTQLEIPAKS